MALDRTRVLQSGLNVIREWRSVCRMRRWDGGERPDLYTAEVWNLRLRKILVRLEERSTLRVEYVPKLRWGSGGAGVGGEEMAVSAPVWRV